MISTTERRGSGGIFLKMLTQFHPHIVHLNLKTLSSVLPASKKPGKPLIISDIRKGSIAHRFVLSSHTANDITADFITLALASKAKNDLWLSVLGDRFSTLYSSNVN